MKRLELSAGLSSRPLLAQIKSNHYTIQAKLSLLLTCLFIAITGWILGKIVWLAIPQSSEVPQWRPSASSVAASNKGDAIDFNALQNANLFGKYTEQKAAVVEQPIVKDAPKTRLNLTLVGAVASSDANTSLAVIANRGKQATYGLGEEIEGTRATLKAVLVDRVIIDNQGRDETLMMEGIEYKKLSESPQVARAQAQRAEAATSDVGEKLEQIREEIAKDPQSVFKYITISPVKKDGDIVGYRVSPGRDAALFNDVGLQPGDIAVQLNGIDLSDPSSSVQLMQVMSDPQELNLTVERDGQQYDIYIQL
ncbi:MULTISPECIES: type II secretion system protein GspC [Vibrio]|uniref:Type II secretion system protein GspC n=4 Tax=Vibrio harveyi group TaxID=717610 RepID=A0A0H0Y6N1_VIBAL|nr:MULTISPECIES: type II secretion system protein GspC [Vibrio]MBO0147968.1 type II secretion system protein GspC [Vibrio sp. Vb2424]MCK8111659.1 type II secretion system protein GspC [Vibrio sp. 2CM40D]MDK9791821.1 type II secretion system protein GspC [Vibrio sp. D431a]MDW1808497.1 type II secretion system protein GspC [Vibrio sp. Vb2362]MDW1972316.1 type II secretion system protein GspC [Vibrio sp. 945]MDW2259014.1 type II secretion system protein GspC [Vibrio sp. 1409]NAW53911.1 type II 